MLCRFQWRYEPRCGIPAPGRPAIPNVATTVYYLGMAYFKMGDTAEANVRFDQAKRLKPDGFK